MYIKVLASVIFVVALCAIFYRGYHDKGELLGEKHRLQSVLNVKVLQVYETGLPGVKLYQTDAGFLLANIEAGVVIRGSLEDMETGSNLLSAIMPDIQAPFGRVKPPPFVSLESLVAESVPPVSTPFVESSARAAAKAQGFVPDQAKEGAIELTDQAKDDLAEGTAAFRQLLQARLADLRETTEDEHADAAALVEKSPERASQPSSAPTAMPPKGAIPRIGFDNTGRPLSAEERRIQAAALMGKLPQDWLMVYPAETPTDTITVLTDPTCPYCRRLHQAIPELNAAGITVRYLFYPRSLGAGMTNPDANRLVERINRAWCSSEPKVAIDRLFAGASAGRSCSELSEDDSRPRDPVEDHYFLGRVIGVNATPYIIHESGAEWTGFKDVRDLIRKVEAAQAMAERR